MNGIPINIDPILFQLGPLTMRWYGLMYAVGIAVGLQIVYPYARERGVGDDDLWSVVWPSIIAGLIGARLYFVVQQPLEPYLAEPWRIFATWEGGMAFYGAVFAVALTIVVVSKLKGLPLWTLLDIGALFAIIGQAFGRVGNIINGDILGAPTNLPWGFIYQNPHSFAPDHTIAYQPAAVYELIFNLVFFGIMWKFRHRFPRSGMLFVVYLIGYSLGQFFVFFLRTEPLIEPFGLKQAQLTAVVVFVAACVLGAVLMSRRKETVSSQDAG